MINYNLLVMENIENTPKILAAIEAILFVYGEPIEVKKIAKLLKSDSSLKMLFESANKSGNVEEEIIQKSLEELQRQYLSESRGLRLIFSGNKVQLVTKPEFSVLLENLIKEEFKEQLSPASLETLSLITYLGPISKAQIDYYRGVNSSFILRSLMIRGLIERFPDPQKSNVYLYQPTFDLLKYLGISRIEELPEYEKFSQIFQANEQQG